MGMIFKSEDTEVPRGSGPGWKEIEQLRLETRDARVQIQETKILCQALRKRDELILERLDGLAKMIGGLEQRIAQAEEQQHVLLRPGE